MLRSFDRGLTMGKQRRKREERERESRARGTARKILGAFPLARDEKLRLFCRLAPWALPPCKTQKRGQANLGILSCLSVNA